MYFLIELSFHTWFVLDPGTFSVKFGLFRLYECANSTFFYQKKTIRDHMNKGTIHSALDERTVYCHVIYINKILNDV